MLGLYLEKYMTSSATLQEKLVEEHGIMLSYTWVKRALRERAL